VCEWACGNQYRTQKRERRELKQLYDYFEHPGKRDYEYWDLNMYRGDDTMKMRFDTVRYRNFEMLIKLHLGYKSN